jgi:hypothetical protein
MNVKPLAELVANTINRHIFFLSLLNSLPVGAELTFEMLDDSKNADNAVGVAFDIKPKFFQKSATEDKTELLRQLDLLLNFPSPSTFKLAFSRPSLLSDLAYDEDLTNDLSSVLFHSRCARFKIKNVENEIESSIGNLTLELLYPESFLRAYGLYNKKDGLTLEEFIKASGHEGLEADYGLEIRRLKWVKPKKKQEAN